LKHHAQALVIVAAVALAFFTLIFTLSIVIPLVVIAGAELMVVTVLPRCEWFRESVDEELECAAIANAIEARGTLLSRISEEHRRELEELERLVGKIAERSREGARIVASDGHSDEDWLGLGRLLGTYVQLAIAHRTNIEALRLTSESSSPMRDLASLEELRSHASSSMLPWIERRLVIARGRVVAAERAREERTMLLHGLATIAELIRWTHDECAASHEDLLRSVLVDAEASCEGHGGTLREIVTLCAELESVDPHVFAVRAQ
jgi:hypothetical protein